MPVPIVRLRHLRHAILLTTTFVGVWACSPESPGPLDTDVVDFGDGLETVACTGLTLASVSGVPLDRVGAGTVPGTLQPPLAAWVLSTDETTLGYAPVEVDDLGAVELITPVHPTGSMEGGEVYIRVSDGRVACAPSTFTIEELPASPGELGAVVDLLQDILGAQASVLGTTPEELRTTPLEGLPDVVIPLGIIQWVLDHPDNDQSLRAVAESTAAEEYPLERIEALLARTGLRDALQDLLPGAGEGVARAPMLAVDAEDCAPEAVGGDTQRLSDCMNAAYEIERELLDFTERHGSELAAAILLEESLGTYGPVYNVLAALGWAVVHEQLLASARMPVELTPLAIGYEPLFLEDEPGPGEWAGTVQARSLGWDTAERLLEERLFGSAFRALVTLGLDRAGASELVTRLLEGEVAGFLQEWDHGPEVFGPVPIFDAQWSGTLYNGESIERVDHTTYAPVAVGTTELTVFVPPGADPPSFGLQFEEERVDITVDSIVVTIEPSDTAIAPGASATFRVTIERAHFVDSVSAVALQGALDSSESTGPYTYDLNYTAPENPDADTPDRITVWHHARTGARANGPERADTAIVRFAGVRITTDPGCLRPGGVPVQMEAEVLGGIPDPELVWSASAGTIDAATGLFTPPEEAQTVIVVVALASDPEVMDAIEVRVGGCLCQAAISVNGVSAATLAMEFGLTADLTAVDYIAWAGEGMSSTDVFFVDENFVRETIPVNATPADAGASVSGFMHGVPFVTADPANQTLPPLTAALTRNNGSILEGSVEGQVYVSVAGELSPAPFSFTFLIEADPDLSEPDVRYCEVR